MINSPRRSASPFPRNSMVLLAVMRLKRFLSNASHRSLSYIAYLWYSHFQICIVAIKLSPLSLCYPLRMLNNFLLTLRTLLKYLPLPQFHCDTEALCSCRYMLWLHRPIKLVDRKGTGRRWAYCLSWAEASLRPSGRARTAR